MSRLEARWATSLGPLAVFAPTEDKLIAASGELAAFYNDPHNAALLSNTLIFSPEEVFEFWRDAATEGTRAFLFERDGELVGDGDFRNERGGVAELAMLIGPRSLQGIGLGARFVLMLLVIGFERLGLERVVVAIRPGNSASLRLFERTGFVRDEGVATRAFAEEDDDVCMVLPKGEFFARHGQTLAEIEQVTIS